MYLPQHRSYLHIMPEIPVSAGALGSRGRGEGNRRKKRRGDAGQAEEGVEKRWVLGRSEAAKKRFKVNQRAAGATDPHCLPSCPCFSLE